SRFRSRQKRRTDVIHGSRAMMVSKTGGGNPVRAMLVAVVGLLGVAALATVAQTKGSPARSTQATAPQARLTVQTNLVLVPVFVYDPARMAQAPKEEMPCARAMVVTFFKLAPTQPYLSKDCDVTEVQGLTAEDFRLFEDGVEQQIGSFEEIGRASCRERVWIGGVGGGWKEKGGEE